MGILDGHAAITTQLKGAYTRIILPFEKFGEHVRGTSNGESQRAPTYATRHSGSSRMGRTKASGGARSELAIKSTSMDPSENPESPPDSPMSSVLSDLPDDAERPDRIKDEHDGKDVSGTSNARLSLVYRSHWHQTDNAKQSASIAIKGEVTRSCATYFCIII